jgi:bifunctional non-homologous end joining protein LigD
MRTDAPREDLPRFLSPMLLRAGKPPETGVWALEVKWDGMRAQVRSDGRRLCLRSRPGRDCTAEFPELEELLDALAGRRVVLDGEIACLDESGRPDFSRLRSRIRARDQKAVRAARKGAPATLMIFDVLHLDGRSSRELPYRERRELLAGLRLDGRYWRTPRYFEGDPRPLLEATREQQLEGVVVKRLDSLYQPGQRSGAWVKTKHRRREILTVTAWQPGRRGQPDRFLVSRQNDAGELRHAGEVSYGLSRQERDRLRQMLAKHDEGPARWSRSHRTVRPVVRIAVDSHGSPTRPLRDPIVRELVP